MAVAAPWASAVGDQHQGASGVQIRRTEYGVPHILAQNYSDLGYGYGYAFAQDNACEMADRVLTLRGERSRYFGATARTNDSLNGTDTNLDSDTYFQALLRAGTVRELLSRPAPLGPTPEMRRLMEGYAAGFDRYLKDVGVAHLPDPTCQGQPWVQPITAEDLWTNILDIDQLGGAAGLRQEIANATPPAPNTSPTTTTTALAGSLSAAKPTGRGSNGWALGADATADGTGMLLANPHLPWNGDARFYQVQLTIPGVLDVTGGALYGTPVVQIGHTAGVAWTHTSTDSDHLSLYQLQLVPGDPTSYLVDGRPERMQQRQVPVTVRGADGRQTTVVRTLYTSRYGPVLADGWTATSALTMRDANADNIRSMDQWLAMDRAQSVDQLRAAQRRYQGSPWTYTIATDTTGAAYFTDNSATPHLTDAQLASCRVAPLPGIGVPLLNGATTACDWGSDPDAVEPGLYGPAAQPALLRRDYVANSNNTPALTNPAAPLTGYPQVFGASPQLALRPQNGLGMIAARIAGTDGLGPAGFTLPTLRELMFDDTDRSAQVGLADVLAMCRAHPTLTAGDGAVVDVRAACTALGNWDGHGTVNSHGEVLWASFFGDLAKGPATWWRVPYDPKQPLTTPRGIDGEAPVVQHAFADAVQDAVKKGVALDAAPGDVKRWDNVPLHGCGDWEGCFNVLYAYPTSGQGGGTSASRTSWAMGSSFMMTVEMSPTGPKASTLLTYSESANPASPHYTDQTTLYSHSQWVTERFTAADIAASPALQVTTLRR
ncbi:penicillin acylase family protein [Catenulispora subtropica]|uniref:Penicillin acylase family protein n=1 Tax=Catenulispora subtropica TaxID=450798 RepID=A0ABN2QWA0_9ACTN